MPVSKNKLWFVS